MQSSNAYPSQDSSERYRTTRLGVIERLGDPYLTDDDRWVLRQFLRFLSGRSPEPDLRVTSLRPERHPRIAPAAPELHPRAEPDGP